MLSIYEAFIRGHGCFFNGELKLHIMIIQKIPLLELGSQQYIQLKHFTCISVSQC